MLRYDFRFWDKDNRRMIEGAGISPAQKPLVARPDGSYEELQGNFVPMINTGQKAVNGTIYEADVIECDVPAFVVDGMPVSYIKARGVMQFNQAKGLFTVNIMSTPEMAGVEFSVTRARIVGCAIANPELLQVNPNAYDSDKKAGTGSEKEGGNAVQGNKGGANQAPQGD